MHNNSLIGKPFPDFKLKTSENQILTKEDLNNKYTIIYLYPKNDTSGCTKENIMFSKKLIDFKKLDVDVYGLSKDNIESHSKFIAKHQLKVVLISDPEQTLIKDLGSWVKKSMYGREYMGIERSTFLLDKNNIIIEIWRKVRVNGHIEKVLDTCNKIIN